jgi:hypothetical protein
MRISKGPHAGTQVALLRPVHRISLVNLPANRCRGATDAQQSEGQCAGAYGVRFGGAGQCRYLEILALYRIHVSTGYLQTPDSRLEIVFSRYL